MSGRLSIVGLGPGPECWVTPAANEAVALADIVLGYEPYVRRLKPRSGQLIEASDNREELARAKRALELAASGRKVAIVSGGDPGVFAMAAAVFEVLERHPLWGQGVEIEVEPGVTAMLAAAARLGAPLGHDFCAISLSDNLKSWATIEHRLMHAAEGDFVIALYNPASKARPDQIRQAFDVLATRLSSDTVVVLAHSIGRTDERIEVTTLAEAQSMACDMRTLVIIGSRATRRIEQSNGKAWVYTPRSEVCR